MSATMTKIFNRREATQLALLALIQFSHIVDFMMVMPLGPQLMRALKIGPSEFGILVSSYTFAAGIMSFVASFFLDRFDRKQALLAFFFCFSLGTIFCGLTTNYHLLVIMRFLTGAFGGVLGSQVLSIVGDLYSENRRATAMSIVMLGFSLASILGVPFSIWLADMFTWQYPFFVLGGVSMCTMLIVNSALPNIRGHLLPNPEALSNWSRIKGLLNNKNRFLALMFMFVLIFSNFMVIPFLSPSLVANVGFKEGDLAFVYLTGGLVTILMSPLIGRLADRFGKPRIFMIFGIYSLFCFYLMTHLGPTPFALALIITSAFFIAMSGRIVPAMALVASVVPPQQRGGFMALSNCVAQLGSATATFIAGHIITKDGSGRLLHYGRVGWVSLVATLFAIIIVKNIKVEIPPPQTHKP